MTVAYAQYAPEPDASDFVTTTGEIYDAEVVEDPQPQPQGDWPETAQPGGVQ